MDRRAPGESQRTLHAACTMRDVLYDYNNVTAQTVRDEVAAAVARAEELVARSVASVNATSFEETLAPLDLAAAEMVIGYGRSAFLAHVHTDSAVRDAAQVAEERISKWNVGLPFRPEVYRAVRAFADSPAAAELTGERRRLLDRLLRDFRRAGNELAPDARSELEQLQNRLVELQVAFARNINEDHGGIEVDRAGLDGLPESFIERLEPGTEPGTFKVGTKGPEYTPFMAQARRRDLREKLLRRSWNKAAAVNRPLLEEALAVRRRMAALFGVSTWAHHAMEVKMAGNPERVRAFYDDIVPPLEAAAVRDVAALQAMAAKDRITDPIQHWDWTYYDNNQALQQHGINQEEVSEYLPLPSVMAGLFELTGKVLGLEYREINAKDAWHPSVSLYEIRDRASGELLAHFYADLFPRDGKFYHAAAFPLTVGHRRPDGSYQTPVSAIVANLTPPSADRPSLLKHGPGSEIETLFHEFGHILHMSLTRAEFARFSGAETEWDFVEAPSQIMEHWTWQPSVLASFARHYRTSEPIPSELVTKLIAGRYLNVGLRGARQVSFGAADLALHATSEPVDVERAARETAAVMHLPYPDGTFQLASFGHLMGSYDAGYYGYLWAEVIGDDMWGRFADEGIDSSTVGAAYRRAVLEPNGTRDGDDLVADFLGRPASVHNYLKMRGLG
ncbi:MAG TPA: M3 family metallopeptidase [Candidatus Limnocylindria bacterium]